MHEMIQVDRESHGQKRDTSGHHRQHADPSAEEAETAAESFPQVDVLSTCGRHHGAQLGISQGAKIGQYAGHHPNGQDGERGRQAARDHVGKQENAGADDDPNDDHGGVEQPEFAR